MAGGGLTLTAAPSQHFSGRGLKDRNATLWSAFVLRSERHAVFFSGDTGLTTEYELIRDRLGPFDLVMEGVGGPSLPRSLQVTAPFGVVTLYGAATGQPGPISLSDFRGHPGVVGQAGACGGG